MQPPPWRSAWGWRGHRRPWAAPGTPLPACSAAAPPRRRLSTQIGYPIGASATSNGVTITADAIMGDTYSYAIVYSIRRDDGSPLVSDETLAAGAERDGLLPLRFRNYGTQVRTSGGGAHGSSWFYDADPADNAIQFVEMMTQDQPLKPGTASVKFQDLSVYTDNELPQPARHWLRAPGG